MSSKYSMSLSQYIFLIYKTQIGIGVLTLPHDIFVMSGEDAWIAILFGWLVSTVISFFIIKTLEKHPDKSLFDIIPKYFGKLLGKVIILIWILYTLLACSYVFLYTILIIKTWVLPNTETILLALLFIIPIFQITSKGLPMISRYAEFTFLITIWMYPVILMAAHQGLWTNLIPIAREGIMPIMKSVPKTALSFFGFEIAFFIYPRLQNKKKAFQGLLIANTMTAFVLIMVTMISYIRLSNTELTFAIWPTLDLLKLIRFPFLERLEIIFISAYIIILLMSVIPYLHVTLEGTNHLIQRSIKTPILISILGIWVIIFALYTPILGFESVMYIQSWFSNLGIIFAFLFPLSFWIYQKVVNIFHKGQVKG